jgi:glycosyltransferase involved in cell wall biosynthesis
MLMTRQNQPGRPDRLEDEQYLYLFEQLRRKFEPDILLTYGAHPIVREVMRRARQAGVTTLFTLRNYGYEDRRWFTHADAVLTCSPFLSAQYRERIGLISTGIPSPIDWSEVVAPTEARAFVTFVNPALHKGATVFARLADMLGSRRPDIPVLVVQSAATAGGLNSLPGIDFSKYPQIMAAPPVPRPADYFALTKILLMPSVFAEPFGRVAAEAMINGIPPLVSDRGALPDTVAGAGRVLPLPEWLTPGVTQVPDPWDVEGWFAAVCELWDCPDRYEVMSRQARETAERLYGEPALRLRYLDYFADLRPGSPLFLQEGGAAPPQDLGPDRQARRA